MYTVPLGSTGVEVSALCLGTMYFGSRTDSISSYKILDQYVEAGGNFLDTANVYACWVDGFIGGESETLLGKWMKERSNRSQVFIASKVGFAYQNVGKELKAETIEQECEKSLKRLGIDTIDLYYAHVDDRNTPLEESIEAMHRLIKAGKVRYIGASNFSAWRLAEANYVSKTNNWTEFCCIQQRHTYLRPRPGTGFDPQLAVNDDLLDYCRHKKISLLAYSVLLSGAYTRADRQVGVQYSGPDTNARLKALQRVANESGATVNQVVLAWLLQGDPPIIPLVAASTTEQMQENLDALHVRLSEKQIEVLNTASAKK